MLNNCSCLFVINQCGCFDDKFFRIELELLENSFLNASQDCNDCFSRQAGLPDQLADQIILHAAVGADLLAAVISR